MSDKLEDVRKKTVFKAPVSKVWQAIATSEGISAWYMPNDFEPRVGHEFTLQTPFGPTPCKVLELDPPKKLVFSWDTFGWQVSFELADLGDTTEFILVHSGWGEPDEIIPRSGQTHAAIREIMNNGWEPIVFESLRKHVES